MLTLFKAIESVKMGLKLVKKIFFGEKIGLRLGKKIDRLEVYTPLLRSSFSILCQQISNKDEHF